MVSGVTVPFSSPLSELIGETLAETSMTWVSVPTSSLMSTRTVSLMLMPIPLWTKVRNPAADAFSSYPPLCRLGNE